MNYFDLVNKCLAELNYKQVNAFSELTKNDHKKIKNIINLVNTEVCNYDNWNFKLRKSALNLPPHTAEIENTIYGRIASLVIDGHVYKYFDKPDVFINGKAPSQVWGSFGDKLLLPEFEEAKNVNVIYYTANTAQDAEGNEKKFLENETDQSLIPDIFAEPVIVYGTCMRLKANPQHVKFGYWLSNFNSALAAMRAKIPVDAGAAAYVKMLRY